MDTKPFCTDMLRLEKVIVLSLALITPLTVEPLALAVADTGIYPELIFTTSVELGL